MIDFSKHLLFDDSILFSHSVILMDDCEGTCNWIATGTGAGFSVAYDPSAAFSGVNGLLLKTRLVAAADADFVYGSRYLTYPLSNYLLFRAYCCIPDISVVERVGIEFYVYNGTTGYRALYYIHPNDSICKFYNAAGNWSDISEHNFSVIDNQWLIIEIAINLSTLTWYSVFNNGIEVDMQNYALNSVGASSDKYIRAIARMVNKGANQAAVYFDNLTVTNVFYP